MRFRYIAIGIVEPICSNSTHHAIAESWIISIAALVMKYGTADKNNNWKNSQYKWNYYAHFCGY